eukprot:CAMPEP_0119368524 /NCGR_PEP_ID=MMETSP1334-20130426/15166_1 /TAXON_ID=127549 /ORGANISM="Calcidiscus leptoporus, Strain RCC1130" /LENGTH=351 /DNA_ID=CAMNT_0007385179 /DNA_START=29 /DNA_END=1084 /DNA_ORIENTATION=+
MSGAALFAAAPSFAQVLVGRILCGVGVGICGLAKPLIVSELAPAHMRGVLVSLFAVGQSIGLNVFYVVDFILPPVTVEWAWRLLVALGASPALLVVLLALLTPASGYWDLAPVSLSRCGGVRQLAHQGGPEPQGEQEAPMRQLHRMVALEPPQVRRNFFLVVAMMLGYNLSGTLIIANYASQIFAAAGASSRALPIVVGLVQFLGLVSAAAFTDRLGRRPLLLASCALSAASLLSIAALLGSGWGPSLGGAFTPLLLALMTTVEFAVGVGLNPIRIVLSAELMPTRYRALGMSLSNAVGWGTALLSLFCFPIIIELAGGPAPQFAFFGATTASLTVLLMFQLPETRGIDFD